MKSIAIGAAVLVIIAIIAGVYIQNSFIPQKEEKQAVQPEIKEQINESVAESKSNANTTIKPVVENSESAKEAKVQENDENVQQIVEEDENKEQLTESVQKESEKPKDLLRDIVDAARLAPDCYILKYEDFNIYVFRESCKEAKGQYKLDYGEIVFQFDNEVAKELIEKYVEMPKALEKLMNNLEKLGNKIIILSSDDGIHWKETGIIAAKDASVPDLVADFNGMLRLYYVHFPWNKIELAVSHDINTWEKIETDIPAGIVDPEIVKVDGKYRLYTNVGIVLESLDGIHFEEIAEAPLIMDPTVFEIDDTWYMIGWNKKGTFLFTSPNGLEFSKGKMLEIKAEICDAIKRDKEIWLYCYSKNGIVMFKSKNGFDWSKGTVVYQSDAQVTDPSVAFFNGKYYMALTVIGKN